MKKIFDQRLFLFTTKITQILLSKLKLYEEIRASTRFTKKRFGDMPLTVVEIGTRRGSNARSICNNLNVKTIYCVDPYSDYSELRQGKTYDYNSSRFLKVAKSRLKKYPVKFIMEESGKAVKYIPKNTVDFVYIDGNHDYAYCLEDIEKYYAKLKSGGVIAGHDFCGNFREVIEAVYTFLKDKPEIKLHTKQADWYFVKP